MLCFGNFRFAFKELSKGTANEIQDKLGVFCRDESEILSKYTRRPDRHLKLRRIPRDCTWFLGYLVVSELDEDIRLLHALRILKGIGKPEEIPPQIDKSLGSRPIFGV